MITRGAGAAAAATAAAGGRAGYRMLSTLGEKDGKLACGMVAVTEFACGRVVGIFHGTEHIEMRATIFADIFVDWHLILFIICKLILIKTLEMVNRVEWRMLFETMAGQEFRVAGCVAHTIHEYSEAGLDKANLCHKSILRSS